MSKSNFSFSSIIVGTMRLGKWGSDLSTQELERFIDGCLDLGLKDFDLADIYGNYTGEEQFGQVLKRRSDLKNKVQITTKCGIKLISSNRPNHRIKSYDTSKEHIIMSVDHSLKMLGVDHIDVLLIHRPDYLMDAFEIAETVEQLKQHSKIKTFGVSNFNVSQFEMLNRLTPLITNQLEISLMNRDVFKSGVLDQCINQKIKPTAWSPFGGGEIFKEGGVNKELDKTLKELEEKYIASRGQVLLAFMLKHPARIIPIVGTSKLNRLEDALQAFRIELSMEDWYLLWQAAEGHEIA